MPAIEQTDKPERLYFKTYLQLLNNSVGTKMFKNFYVKSADRGEFDAMKGGEDSCAFFVSSVLTIFEKLKHVHGTVDNTVADLKESGWQEVSEPKLGDVLVWEAQKFGDGYQSHIGFYVGDGQAVSTSWKQKMVISHSQDFDGSRKIEQIYRMDGWDDKS